VKTTPAEDQQFYDATRKAHERLADLEPDNVDVDAEIVLAAIYRRGHRAQDAIPLLEDLIQRLPRNFLPRFEIAQMYSDLGDKTAAKWRARIRRSTAGQN
jgi:predicted Zn-dependent protease